jgi:hypothetical protein
MERPTEPRTSPVRMIMAFVIIELTAVTGYLHYSLGGELFLLNAFGYLVLGAAYSATLFLPIPLVQRFAWLPRLGLAAYTLVTIGAYLVIGPYFSLGWIAKGIEVAIVILLAVDIVGAYRTRRGLVRAAIDSLPFVGPGRRSRPA